MDEIEFFKSCDINISDIDWIMGYLIDAFPQKSFFIDALPKVVTQSNADKFNQIEFSLYNDTFYKKILNVIKKLWLYDDLFFCDELFFNKKTKRHVPISMRNIYKKMDKKSNKIESVEQIELLFNLQKKNVIDVSYIFSNNKIYITPSWNCLFVFINNLDKLEFIEDMVNREGLYLRSAN